MPPALPISIRPYELADIPNLYEAARESTATVFPWLPWCHPGYEIAEAREWVAMQVENFKAGKEYNFVILSPEGRFLGGGGGPRGGLAGPAFHACRGPRFGDLLDHPGRPLLMSSCIAW